jgi:hypothetical protein
MTKDEKNELREWMAQGRSVNSNPFYVYGDNGCLLDFINASKAVEDMDEEHETFTHDDTQSGDDQWLHDPDLPF